jgi:hypothetical protein
MEVNSLSTRHIPVVLFVLFTQLVEGGVPASYVPPDDILKAAGYDVNRATSEPAKRRQRGEDRPYYLVRYIFGRQDVVLLELDAQTSQTVDLTGEVGRSTNPTSPTGTLTPQWARQMLNRMNVYKVPQGQVRLGEPTINYLSEFAEYHISFPRTDVHGRPFTHEGVVFTFDPGTSKVTVLAAHLDLPEPAVTTGTMITEDRATSLALAGLNSHKPMLFRHVPEKMGFARAEKPTVIRVVEKDNTWSPGMTDIDEAEETGQTAVAYLIHFRSVLQDPNYTVPYDRLSITVYVDAFTGELVGADYFKEFIIK